FHGHFLNWYDTKTLLPLSPQYVSTVDSGNLAGHLITLKQACVEIAEQPLFDLRVIEGLSDTILLMREEADKIGAVRQSTGAVTPKQLRAEIDSCATLMSHRAPKKLSQWTALLQSMTERVVQVEDMIGALSHEHGGDKFEQLHSWTYSLMHQLRQHRRDLSSLTPWSLAFAPSVSDAITSCSYEMASEWKTILDELDRVPTLDQVAPVCAEAITKLASLRKGIEQCTADRQQKALKQLDKLLIQIKEAPQAAGALAARYAEIARRCDSIMEEMEFGFLFVEERKVFVIGYNVTEGRRDNSYYDLLASESRLASFVAIAKGDVPQEHWFRLGRALTQVDGSRALISWTATMFEYLMPLLVMRAYPDTLLDQTNHAIVVRQIEYGGERGVPWGVSEAGYNARDLQLNYQYGPFGVPGLGLKRGLGDDLVVSPYSTALAAMVEPRAALENMNRLIREGALSRYGFYEAIDYTADRLQPDQESVLVKAFMVHHQGMIMVALDNLLHGNVMQTRFHSEPLVQATELLLQERIPREVPLDQPLREEVRFDGHRVSAPVADPRRFETANLPTPRTQLLSNGVYSVVVTTAGSGYSVCSGLAVTRWREDVTRDNWGSFCYLRDIRSGAVWSAGHLPVPGKPQSYEVALAEDKAEFRRSDAGIVTHTEIIVSPEDNTEVRQVSVTNNTTRPRDIE
ncbi:MAG TPA: glucoamylase family protein, partial [Blastocatellia bacterium]|nr:glucoamylase family protein [Blastocatellia bacterium]